MKKKIKLSQCMIVRNEEKNIRSALSWGKGIVCEQIVVDTGSADKTVEIAEAMGAKVFHYKWNNDFSAAKNFALKQAHGDWIAFLDADEYFNQKDAGKILDFLEQITERFPKGKKPPEVVRSPLMNLNDEGKIFSSTLQDRIFRNVHYIHYENRIHEVLRHTGGGRLQPIRANELIIYHTGYANSVLRDTNKRKRNIEILASELEADSQNYDVWSYYGDALIADGQHDEAEQAYRMVIEHEQEIKLEQRRNTAYCSLMRIIIERGDENAESKLKKLYEQFSVSPVQCPDMEYWMGIFMYRNEKYREAIYWFELALERLENYVGTDLLFINGDLEQVYERLACAHNKEGEILQTVRYTTLVLRKNKYCEPALERLLFLFKNDKGTNSGQVYEFLKKIYCFSDFKDRLFVLKQAKRIRFIELEEEIIRSMSTKEREWLLDSTVEDTGNISQEVLQELYKDIPIQNRIDYNFLALIHYIKLSTEEMLQECLKRCLFKIKEEHYEDYATILKTFEMFPLWGRLSPENGEYGVFKERVHILKKNIENFLWLYRKLEDYRSKQVLYGILENWVHMEKGVLTVVKDSGLPFLDLDLLPNFKDSIYVSIGTHCKETLQGFLYLYGNAYKKVECFEISPEIEPSFSAFTEEMRDTALHLVEDKPDVVIDEATDSPIDLITINVQGAAEGVLKGCSDHIKREHPNLAICTDNGYEEITKIPLMIAALDSSYQFYMRYYGGDLIPTKYVLYAVYDNRNEKDVGS